MALGADFDSELTMKRKIYTAIAILALSGAYYLGVSVKSDWQNFSFSINDNLSLRREGSSDIYLYGQKGKFTLEGGLGPAFELADAGKSVLVRHYGLKEGKADPNKVVLLSIPKSGEGAARELGSEELSAAHKAEFKSIRRAHKEALRSGRAKMEEVDRYLLGQAGFLFANIHFIALYSLLPGFIIGSWLRGREKKRPFITGWAVSLGGIAGVILLISFISWLDMRFF